MSGALAPRAVVVRRPTEYELLIQQHGTRSQAAFYLDRQGQKLDDVDARHQHVERALSVVRAGIPLSWRNVNLLRSDLDRFVFEDKDIIVPVGQDGLVANVAKYLDGQYVVGINPDPNAYEGVLVPHQPEAVADLLNDCANGRARTESRTMVEATLDDGQRLLALNEIFVGHHSHQSARYRIAVGSAEERQSSSGMIVSTGTGATGWARSINQERNGIVPLPKPEDRSIAFFVREAFPGSGFETKTTYGLIKQNEHLKVTSEMNVGGVLFGDGIEEDSMEFLWGSIATIAIGKERLQLVRAA